MTLNEIVFDIMEFMRGTLTDDEDIDPRQIAFWVRTQRALWLSRESASSETDNPSMEQDLGCVDIVMVDSAECDIEAGVFVLRTKDKIPSMLSSSSGLPLITRVGPVDKIQKNFSIVPYERAKYVGIGRFNRQEIRSFFLNGYVYLAFSSDYKEPSMLSKINIRGVLENPEDAGAYQDSNGVACFTYNSPYPVPMKYIDFMKEHILKNYARLKMMLPSDEVNDASATLKTSGGNNATS